MVYSKKKKFIRTRCTFCIGSGWQKFKQTNKMSSYIKVKCPRCGGKGIYVNY